MTNAQAAALIHWTRRGYTPAEDSNAPEGVVLVRKGEDLVRINRTGYPTRVREVVGINRMT